MTTRIDRALGSVFGAAGGDSLGAAVEFMSLSQIRQEYGQDGIQEPDAFYGFSAFCITDDTQQAIALGEGLIAAIGDGLSVDGIRRGVWSSLKRWHQSQSDPRQRRAPGATSMSSLSGDVPGSLAAPLNRSDSCGSVMRAHPVGILYAGHPEAAYEVGVETAVLTHGGILGRSAAGMLAVIVSELCVGKDLRQSYVTADRIVQRETGIGPLLTLARRAMELEPAQAVTKESGLGEGWEGHDALAIGLYAARCHEYEYLAAVRLAANHDGDSDSTASIAGALVGARLGLASIPRSWYQQLERRADIARVANVLAVIEPISARPPA